MIHWTTRELRLTWRFVRRDLSTTIIPSLIFTVAALKAAPPATLEGLLLALGRWALYFGLYVLTFCLGDQLVGIEEDRLNKPDRPLPAGDVSPRGALARWVVWMVAFTATGWLFGILVWTLVWQVTSVLHTFGRGDKHWFTKNNVAMTVGTLAEIAPAWELVAPVTPAILRWMVVVALLAGATAHVQDFRDVVGDRAVGRKTLPIALGDARARRLMVVAFALSPLIVHLELMPPSVTPASAFCELWLAAMALAT